MIITLIGFSSTGKSYWAKRLATELGFYSYCCDDLIEKKLQAAGVFSGSGIYGVANWLGMPYDKGFSEREQLYLQAEREVMDQLFEIFEKQPPTYPVVIDTTGSVIYTGEDRCHRLQEISKVVYLDVDQEKTEQMLQNFIAKPKPILWGNLYNQQENESRQEATRRCYSILFANRAELYKKYAEITIPFSVHKKKSLTSREFIEIISSS